MLPRRLAVRASSLASCSCRCHLPIAPVARFLPIRTLTSSTSRWKPAAAQLAEPEQDFEPTYHHTPAALSSIDSSLLSTLNPLDRRPRIHVPSPLPSDVITPSSDPRSTLYPTTGVIDSVSMISICLRRPEHTPRAYQIFMQLLEDHRSGKSQPPSAELWGRVTEGAARLGGEINTKDAAKRETWTRRAQNLVDKWEMHQRTRGLSVVAGGGEGGIKVYQGWFAGSVSVGSSIDALAPYFSNDSLKADQLFEAIRPSDLPLAYEALADLAHRHHLKDLGEQVHDHQEGERNRREFIARAVVDEVKPVSETAGRNILRHRSQEILHADAGADAEAEAASPRFAVVNLRNNLSEINNAISPRQRQFNLENASYAAAQAEMKRAYEITDKDKRAGSTTSSHTADDSILQRQKLQGWMYEWLGALQEKLTKDIQAMKERNGGDASEEVPNMTTGTRGMKEDTLVLYLSLLPLDKLALITIIELMRQAGSHGVADGMKSLRGFLAVGKAIETEYRAETIKTVAGVDSPQWLRTLDPQTQKPTRQLVGSVWRKLGKQLDQPDGKRQVMDTETEEDLRAVWTPAWSQMTQLGLGSYLVDALLQVAKVDRTAMDPATGERIVEQQQAFTHGYDYMRGKKLGVIRLNPVVASRLQKDSTLLMVHPKHLPMLVQPRAWEDIEVGGYLTHKVPVMRYKESTEQRTYLRAASANKHMEAVYHGLDVLSSTPWAINRKIFDVVLSAWNTGEPIADIPASEDKAMYDLPPRDVSGDPQQRAIYVDKAKSALAQSRKDHNERCKFNYNLEIARAYLNDTFYLPHSMDFRGRAYPIPPHLSPVGDDLCRGLLTFGERRPLGKVGLKWLQIQLSNVYGYDKASFDERARFAQDHEADIFDSADRPLDGNRWWLKAEDPWQCLATCFDLTAALRSPNPELYESSLPVHQDGTCNGMQHYAALGGDVRGAKAVNLENGDRPADIYTGVADVVNKVIEQDQAEGHPVAQLIKEPLGRKVVKQTVMTTVYGVTFIGARDQIARQMVARGDISPDQIFVVSGYIAKTVLSCIGDIFSGAKDIMDWLTTSARLIARSIPAERVESAVQRTKTSRNGVTKYEARLEKELMTSVVWTSPLGLPIVQPYRKAAKKQVMTALQSVYISDPNALSQVSPQKQATAFPPNFIHSLDATHMLLTATRCKQAEITFASVHDSYWTHAATVEPMSELIRGEFIRLHSQDLIGQLRDEFLERYGEHFVPVKNARAISNSAATKRKKDSERRKQLASLLGEDIDSPIVTAAVDGVDADVTSLLSESADADADDSDLDRLSAESDLEVDEDVPESAKRRSPVSLELSTADLASLQAKSGGGEVPEEVLADQRFVKFKDILPPPPARGSFDVSRIKDSAYFFS